MNKCTFCGSTENLIPDGGFFNKETGKDEVTGWCCQKCSDESEREYQRQLIEIDIREGMNDE